MNIDLPEDVSADLATIAQSKGKAPSEVVADLIKRAANGPLSLTRADVARVRNVSLRTVDNWLRDGLPHTKVGGVRVALLDLEVWMKGKRTAR